MADTGRPQIAEGFGEDAFGVQLRRDSAMSEMFIFSANGRAGKDNSFGYSAGEKHALLIILRQPSDSEPDWLAGACQ